MTRNSRRDQDARGLSLIEILVALGLTVVMLGISLVALRTPNSKRTSDTLAYNLLATLQTAQATAMAEGVPTGVALSTDGREAACSAYILKGFVSPRIEKVFDYSADFPDTYLTSVVSDGSPSTEQPETGDGFLRELWDEPRPQDPVLIFLPSGQVTSNGLLHDDGNYRILVGNGMQLTPESSPSQARTFRPTSVGNPYTISINHSGAMFVEKGVPNLPGLASTFSVPSVGSLPTPQHLAGGAPEIVQLKAFPATAELPDGVDVLVPVGGIATFSVEARSPSGLPLFAAWEASVGAFSSEHPLPLEWYPAEGLWRGFVDWKLPTDAAPGEIVELKVVVRDSKGQAQAFPQGTAASSLNVEIGNPSDRIAFDDGLSVSQIHEDGSGERRLFWDRPSELRWSPDGTKLVGVRRAQDRYKIVLALPEVGEVKVLADLPSCSSPVWSPDGTQVAFAGPGGIHVVGADGSNLRSLGAGAGFSWSPDSKKVLYHISPTFDHFTANSRVWIADAQGGPAQRITNENSFYPVWLPLENRIFYVTRSAPNWNRLTIRSIRPDGSNPRTELSLNFTSGLSSMPYSRLGVSHDERFLSFGLATSEPQERLHTYDWAAGSLTMLDGPSLRDHSAAWSPTSNRVLVRGEGRPSSVLQAQADGSKTNLLRPQSFFSDPDITRWLDPK